MGPDDHVCLCFRVSQRKLVRFMERERPPVASRLSECLGAGTGCQWCVPFLRRLHAQWAAGAAPALPMPVAEYAAARARYRSGGARGIEVETQSQYHAGSEPPMAAQQDQHAPIRIPLAQLRRGQRAIVDCSELVDLPEGDRCLLHAMGMHHECEVRVCTQGTPCIVQIDATRLGISGEVARKILVTPIDDAPGKGP